MRLEAMTQERKEGRSSWAERQSLRSGGDRGGKIKRKRRNRKRGWQSDRGNIVGNENSETAGCGWERVKTQERENKPKNGWMTKCMFARAFVRKRKTKAQLPHPHGYLRQTPHYSRHGPVSLLLQVLCRWLHPEAGTLHNATIFPKIERKPMSFIVERAKMNTQGRDKTNQP